MGEDDEWVSITTAADYLGLSADTVRRRVDAGDLVGRRTTPKVGNRQVSRASLIAYRKAMQGDSTSSD